MFSPPFLVNALINDEVMVQGLIDNGCLCSGIICDKLVSKLNLPRIPITPRPLETAENSSSTKLMIKHVTHVNLDLDGYIVANLSLYVVPNSTHQLILGKMWLEDQDAVIISKDQCLHLGKLGGFIYSTKAWNRNLSQIPIPQSTTVGDLTSMIKTVPICRASIEDISKALRVKPRLSKDAARLRLPKEIRDFAHIFADDEGADDLPPNRDSLNHAINLRKENGETAQPPWGPLYGMSREELLVLRKTLTELSSKGWIRPSSSAAAAPVLFAKKPNGGLRFCVDYRGLNAITIPDRYPLPLFNETLRQLSKAK
ncbi:hypothetical protein K3495_g11747 [Podosphaera aphanis]|nr:hypothetical protein K3495_g11747 [Podosphaera aphanis]